MKILTVVNPENDTQITCYAAKCSNDMLEDVETAFEELDIAVDPDVVEEIAYHLSHGYNYWYNELFCFEVVNVLEINNKSEIAQHQGDVGPVGYCGC